MSEPKYKQTFYWDALETEYDDEILRKIAAALELALSVRFTTFQHGEDGPMYHRLDISPGSFSDPDPETTKRQEGLGLIRHRCKT